MPDALEETFGATVVRTEDLDDKSVSLSAENPIDANVREALLLFQEEDRDNAVEADGSVRDGAFVAELTDLMDLSCWSEGARLICRTIGKLPALSRRGSAQALYLDIYQERTTGFEPVALTLANK